MKLHIIDNGFANKAGHNFEYTKSIYEEWVRRGNEALIYCNFVDDAAVRGKFNLMPIFSSDTRKFYFSESGMGFLKKPFHALNGFLNIFGANGSFLHDLKKIDRKSLSSEDVIFVHTLNQRSLFALYRWYRSLDQYQRPWFVLLFRNTTMHYGDQKHHLPVYYFYKILLGCLERLRGSKKIIFTTDSDVLATEYETMTRRKVHVLPIPHIPDLPFRAIDGSASETIFAYIGEARESKGYNLLPAAVDFMIDHRGDRRVRFLIQSNTPKDQGERIMRAKKELAAMRDGVEIIDRALGTKEYYDLLERADAVVIPYTAENYYAQTSGIFTEALAFGKPVIVPAGTWMAHEFVKYRSGGVIFNVNNEGSLGNAILSFFENSKEAKERAGACRADWIKYHNAKNYMDMFLSLLHG